jgi:CO/xanthine dehydrogenase FAD-binding subunit
VESLYDFTTSSDQLLVGACVPLSHIQHKCESLANDSRLTRTVMPIHDMLRWFASTQIRNVGKDDVDVSRVATFSKLHTFCLFLHTVS